MRSLTGQKVTVMMFECWTLGETIPYTLVCDFRHDCRDGSDEMFCKHPEINDGFRQVPVAVGLRG
jgi:hypothetical protein